MLLRFISLFHSCTVYLFLTVFPTIWTYHNLPLICWWISGCLPFGLFWIKMLLTFYFKSLWTYVFIPLRLIPRSETAGFYGKSLFNSIRNFWTVFQSCCICWHFLSHAESSDYSKSSSTLGAISHLRFGHPLEKETPVVLSGISPTVKDVTTFHVSICHG